MRCTRWLLAVCCLPSFVFANAVAEIKNPQVFAVVAGQSISMQDFEMAYQAGIRKRFYHGKVPDEALKKFRHEVSDTLIERVLLIQEAQRQGLRADRQAIEQQLAVYEKRYANSERFRQHKDKMLDGLREALSEENILQQLEQRTRQVSAPDAQQLQAFYQSNQALFTTPEQVHLSLILLSVNPSSSAQVWQAAQQEAEGLYEKLKNGARFEQLARIHSGDASAAQGGDMGFTHKGVLAPAVQAVLDKLQPGEVSKPVSTLRGIALFKMQERRKAQLNSFADVRDRAAKLWQREQGSKAWDALRKRLRANTQIDINQAAL